MASFKMDGKAILIVFVGLIIAVTFLSTISDTVFTQTNTATVTNVTVTAPAINATIDLTGRTLLTSVLVINASNESSPNNNGLILQNGIGTNGLNTVQLTINDTAGSYAGISVNVSYTYQPEGYIQNASARSVTLLIVLFGALAALVFTITVFIREGSLGKLIRGERLS